MYTPTIAARKWSPDKRLHPWAVYDLERLTWVIEERLAELSPQERAMVQAAVDRLSAALADTGE